MGGFVRGRKIVFMKRIDLVKRIAATVLATGVVGAVAVAPAAAASVDAVPDLRAQPVASWEDLLPPQLNCLISTGWAVFCLGIPLS
ncbi:hypothetical protein NS14008_33380 [Nocardia seriolae]|nr:hypothetical protein NS14008_33380 [Nocardia seriolae]PSK27762.1 hypothetical protein C6575_30045 [Nocardia seriolae]RLP31123.1 hypothetical protein D6158_14960 [Nocardia seriolae]